jgi:tetratricopeptide (TPR) repeat protein
MISMNLTTPLVGQPADQLVSLSERAHNACRLARDLEKAGEYEAACATLGEFWSNRHEPPSLDGLEASAQAEVLLRVGNLVGWTGSASQAAEGQETAKNLISRSIEIFEKLGDRGQVAAALSDLALCYWRQGAFDEARVILRDVASTSSHCSQETRAIALIRQALVEKTAGRYGAALEMYTAAAPLVENIANHALKGAFHNGQGTVLNRLALAKGSEDEMDRALIEFAAASYHFEQAGHHRYQASVETNLGFLFFTLGRFPEAHEHLNHAGRLFRDLRDSVHVAQVDDTRARTLLGEGRLNEAERFAQAAVKTLERGGEQSLLAEALTTHGIALARMGKIARAKTALQRASEVAQTSGDLEGAGRAHLSTIEELGQQISVDDLVSHYRAALDLLGSSQDQSTIKRLISCAQKVIGTLGAEGESDPAADENASRHSWEGFSFKQQVLDYEKEILSRALRDTGGAVTKAARLLGFNHHQSLIALINSRHKGLLGVRSAVRKRRRSIIKFDKDGGKKRARGAKGLTATD